ncbi:GyrI-like domain-containing protein [Paenibacillus sp. GCM10012307]|uniref:GyrI-like domain-containing protein n=1 Tax=Paenibacillus roseus TaxID=2798579 RepID=A0A934J051_9BACL|nr:GyrI-like domain-containing protein [Paenibacillus roseus]MBJ6362416.1 GyrI-like domain-containing protein [Paenibacillus roseus]
MIALAVILAGCSANNQANNNAGSAETAGNSGKAEGSTNDAKPSNDAADSGLDGPVTAADLSKLPEQRFHIPGGKYQVFWHKGEVEKLPLTYRYIYGTWFTRNPIPLVGGFDFEYYDGSFQASNDAEAMVKIYVPIA